MMYLDLYYLSFDLSLTMKYLQKEGINVLLY